MPLIQRRRYCTCNNAGTCGECPSIAITATRQGQLPRTSGDNGRAAREAGAKATRRIARRWK